jgi:outer membrane protein OmpA-like peptidoglycan-associated protein
MKHCSALCTLLLVCALAIPAQAQFRDVGLGGGVGFGGVVGATDDLANKQGRFIARAFLRIPVAKAVQVDLGAGLGRLHGINSAGASKGNGDGTTALTQLVPLDLRLMFSPFSFESWNPFLYVGGGVIRYDVEEVPGNADPAVKTNGWSGYAPGGIGFQFRLDDHTALELSGGYNYVFDDKINTITNLSQTNPAATSKDAYWSALAGLTVASECGSCDPDGDGLTNKEEKQLGTNGKLADTDGDGLSDGAEVLTHKTNPTKADTDGDGLKDGEEVNNYKTDPNKADTDGDGLNDGQEVGQTKTNPLKADTDGDGLNDGAEVNTHKTDPTKTDSDGDGLSDGAEVNTHKTNPNNADTDAGSVTDGQEVAEGKNPLDGSDDVKKDEIKVEVGQAIVLEGIVFKTGSATIEPQSEEILTKAFNTMDQNKDLGVEIRGYTDNVGNRKSNMKLSLRRAESVKAWLVKKGVASSRIAAKGFGPDNPIADNKTADGRQKNRRIEFFRTK